MRWLKPSLRLPQTQPTLPDTFRLYLTVSASTGLFRRRATLAHREHLASAIGATVGAGMMREPRLMALRTDLQLWNLDLVMLTPMTLARVSLAFLW